MRAFFPLLLILAAVPAPGAEAQTRPAQSIATAEEEFLRARRLEREGKIEEAVAALKRAIERAPDSAELRAELSGLYAREDRAVEAIAAAEDALRLDPSNVEANKILGSIFAAGAEQKRPVRPGDDPAQYPDRAVAALEKARGIPGSDLNVELALGRLHLLAERYDRAIDALRHLVDQQPQYSEGGMMLAAAQEGAGKYDDAIVTLETTLQLNPTLFRGYLRLIALYEQQRRWKDAVTAYGLAQQVNPKADLLRGHAMALINSGSAAEAEKLLRPAIASATTPDPALLYLLVEAQRKQKNYPAAIQTVEKLRAGFPDRTVFIYQHAQLLEESGRIADAERELRALLVKDPLDAQALNALGYMFAERGERLDEAVQLLQRAVKVEPGNPSFLDSLGWAFFKQGRFELADPPLSEAAQKMPDNSVIQDHLGDLRFRQHRFAEAVVAWERALAGDGESIDRAVIEKKLRDAQSRLKK